MTSESFRPTPGISPGVVVKKVDWAAIVAEASSVSPKKTPDELREQYLSGMRVLTGRNIIAYYSGWCQKAGLHHSLFPIGDDDMNGFMNAVSGCDKSKGLDLILHTPGGGINATEAIVKYLHSVFNGDIRVFVPHLAMSAGTMISLSCKEIWMGKHSALGPIDPQINGMPAHGVIDEFEKACEDFSKNPARAQVWNPILAQYWPTLIDGCNRAIARSEKMVRRWLVDGMFKDVRPTATRNGKVNKVLSALAKQHNTLDHGRHYHIDDLAKLGITVKPIESDESLQNAVMAVHHSFIYTFNVTHAVKLIEAPGNRRFIKVAPVPATPQKT